MKKKVLAISILAALVLGGCSSTPLGKFGGEKGKKVVAGKTIRLPYTDVKSYYGYVKPGSEADEVKHGKKYNYIYVWIPVAAPEIGVRMVSPVPNDAKVVEGDFVSRYWNERDNGENYFDTYIEFERSLSIIDTAQITETNVKNSNWQMLKSNDDSGEVPALPSGAHYNSLLRVETELNNPTKALVRGLYRIGFTTFKRGEVKGSFIAQVGAPIKIPGVIMANSIEELQEKLREADSE